MNWNPFYIIRNWKTLKLEQKRTAVAVLIIGTALLLFTLALVIGIASCAGKAKPTDANAGTAAQIPEILQPPESEAGTPADEPEDADAVETNEPAAPEEPVEDYGDNDPTGEDDPAAPTEQDESVEPLKKHDKGEAVTKLQTRLMELGYLEIDETTDYFGSSTEYALELFQRQHGLEQDGIAGAETQKLLYSKDAQAYTLKEGAEGRDVKMLQEQLVDLGYLSESEVDRVYGPTTVEAVKAFQKRNGLSTDGLAGEKTLEKLYSDEAKISKSLEEKQKAEEKAQKEKEKKEKEKDKDKKATPTPTTKKETRIEKFIKVAQSKIGSPYVLGGRGPKNFDCSGFVFYCLRQVGVSTNRLTASGFSKKASWKNISNYADIQKGDILFFKSDNSTQVSHCGIYVGSGMMIDASSGNEAVVKRAVSAYWKRNFVNARRPWG